MGEHFHPQKGEVWFIQKVWNIKENCHVALRHSCSPSFLSNLSIGHMHLFYREMCALTQWGSLWLSSSSWGLNWKVWSKVLTKPFGNIPKALSLISFIYFHLHQTPMPCFLTSSKLVGDGCSTGPAPQTPSLAHEDDYQAQLCVLGQGRS